MLYTTHAMLAAMMKVEELALDHDEALALGNAIAEVSKHYDVKSSPVVIAWTGLAFTVGTIYGPRFAAIKMRRTLEKMAVRQATGQRPATTITPQPSDPFPRSNPPADPFGDRREPASSDPFDVSSLGMHMSGEKMN